MATMKTRAATWTVTGAGHGCTHQTHSRTQADTKELGVEVLREGHGRHGGRREADSQEGEEDAGGDHDLGGPRSWIALNRDSNAMKVIVEDHLDHRPVEDEVENKGQ